MYQDPYSCVFFCVIFCRNNVFTWKAQSLKGRPWWNQSESWYLLERSRMLPYRCLTDLLDSELWELWSVLKYLCKQSWITGSHYELVSSTSFSWGQTWNQIWIPNGNLPGWAYPVANKDQQIFLNTQIWSLALGSYVSCSYGCLEVDSGASKPAFSSSAA